MASVLAWLLEFQLLMFPLLTSLSDFKRRQATRKSARRSRMHQKELSRESLAILMKTWFLLTSLETTDHPFLMLRLEFSFQRHLSSLSHGTTMRWVTPTASST